MKMAPPLVPADVAAAGVQTEVFYPAMVKGAGVDSYPRLVWRQPWLSADSIIHWPLLLDVDQKPFTAWTKRVD
jgi:hypothetical protein